MAPSRDNKTTAMARFWMGSYLRKFTFFNDDLRTPVSFNLSHFYGFIKKFLKHFSLEKEDLNVLTNHRELISIVQEGEPVSRLAFGEPTTVWRNVNHSALPNRLRDLSWMTAHEILPVRSVMHSRGMAAACPNLPPTRLWRP